MKWLVVDIKQGVCEMEWSWFYEPTKRHFTNKKIEPFWITFNEFKRNPRDIHNDEIQMRDVWKGICAKGAL